MIELKPLSKDAVQAALAKAERYRLLNEPGEAESICLDILNVEPDNQAARITLLLSLTDQFGERGGLQQRVDAILSELGDEYERAYYQGLVAERRAKAQMSRGGTAASLGAHEWIALAMESFERAEALRPAGNDDAILRWNACARFLQRHPQLRPEERGDMHFLE